MLCVILIVGTIFRSKNCKMNATIAYSFNNYYTLLPRSREHT
jgi:hypothetical protein